MFYANRDYMEFFVKDPVGNQMAEVAIFFQLVGYIIMKKIVNDRDLRLWICPFTILIFLALTGVFARWD